MKISRSLLWICLVVFLAASISAQIKATQNKPLLPGNTLNQNTLPKLGSQITKVRNRCFGTCDEYDISGINFGASQGTKKFLMDGQEQKIEVWKEGQISIGPNALAPVGDHVYHFGIYDQGKLISNDYTQTFLPIIDSFSPAQGSPGIKVTLIILTGGTNNQGPRILKMGTAVMSIVSWTKMKIEALVPSLAPGSYAIEIWDGAKKLAGSSTQFKVIN